MRRSGDTGPGSRIVFVSDALQARLDTYLERGVGRTATSVTFDAIEHFRRELPYLIHHARARPVSPPPELTEIRYLGAGPVQIRLRPGAAGAEVLDRLSTDLGLSWRTWVPPVLNAYLPGRREPENMPWLVQGEPPGVGDRLQAIEPGQVEDAPRPLRGDAEDTE